MPGNLPSPVNVKLPGMVEGCLPETDGAAGFHPGEQRQVDADDIRNAGIASGGLPVSHQDDMLPITWSLSHQT